MNSDAVITDSNGLDPRQQQQQHHFHYENSGGNAGGGGGGGGNSSITGGSSIVSGGGSIGSIGHETGSRGGSGVGGCFFADATLDLDEAHDIAETPEPPRRFYDISNINPSNEIEIPNLRAAGGAVGAVGARGKAGSGGNHNATNNNDNNNSMMNNHDGSIAVGSADHQQQNSNSSSNAATVSGAAVASSTPGVTTSTTATTATTSTSRSSASLESTSTTPTAPAASAASSSEQQLSSSSIGGGGGIMNRITNSSNNNDNGGGNSHYNNNDTTMNIRPQRPPRWPRDLNWAIAFCIFVPISLFWPIFHRHVDSKTATYWNVISPLTRKPLSSSSLYTVFLAYIATVLLARGLYRTMGGNEGDDSRHTISKVLLSAAPIAVFLYVFLTLSIYYLIPRASWVSLIPIWYVLRDVIIYRRWKRRYAANTTNYTNTHALHAFFQALVCMALDILSRKLRRVIFYRVISILLAVQLLVVMIWRWAILSALSIEGHHRHLLFLLALLGGKWATGTVARMLSLIASGGIAGWFAQQTNTMEEMEEIQQQQQKQQAGDDDNNNNNGTANNKEYNNNNNNNTMNNNYNNKIQQQQQQLKLSTIPEAYRTVDASVYQPVLNMEHDDIDDEEFEELYNNSNDDDDYDDFDMEAPTSSMWNRFSSSNNNTSSYSIVGSHNSSRDTSSSSSGSTVKSILLSGLTVSFGSVARCGLTGGLAQFIWCQLRKVDEARTVIRQRFPLAHSTSTTIGGSRNRGFQGMSIGTATNSGSSSSSSLFHNEAVSKLLSHVNLFARNFVRSHSDLAMSHVAAYYKSYNRAARDVAQLVDESGVEPIIHDDITTHMCACVGGSISALIVIITSYVVVHYRNHYVTQAEEEFMTDAAVAKNMILIFVLSYTIIFTVMEPIRASIKAVYVCFAQHPRSLRQSFPLIFHRLSRISGESSTNDNGAVGIS